MSPRCGDIGGLFSILLFSSHLAWGEEDGAMPSFSDSYLQECPIRFFVFFFFFYSPRRKKQICKQIYIDLFVEDYSVVIIAKSGNGRVSLVAGGMFP